MKKICMTIIILVLIVGLTIVIGNENKKSSIIDDSIITNSNEKIENEDIDENNFTDQNSVIVEDLVTIESTKDKPIQKDGVEASIIDIKNFDDNLLVTTTLKNNTNKTIKSFYIEIELLSKDGQVLSIIAEDSKGTIEPNGEFIIENNIAGIKNREDIVNARIRNLK